MCAYKLKGTLEGEEKVLGGQRKDESVMVFGELIIFPYQVTGAQSFL